MYTLSDDQLSSVETFIGKLESSLIKSRVEKWLAEVEPTRRITGEQLEQFNTFATHLPKEVQYFPSAFVQTVKNTPETEKREAKEGTEEVADLTGTLDASIEDVADASGEENQEETLHKLGKVKKTKTEKSSKKVPAKKSK